MSALPYNHLSKGLLYFPGNMLSESINNLYGTRNFIPPSIPIHMDLTKCS